MNKIDIKFNVLDLSHELMTLKEDILSIVTIKDYHDIETLIDFKNLLEQFIVTSITKGDESLDCNIMGELYRLCFTNDDFYLIRQLMSSFKDFLIKKKDNFIFLGSPERVVELNYFASLPMIVIGIVYEHKDNFVKNG